MLLTSVSSVSITLCIVSVKRNICLFTTRNRSFLAGICTFIFIFHLFFTFIFLHLSLGQSKVCDGCVSGSGTSCPVNHWLDEGAYCHPIEFLQPSFGVYAYYFVPLCPFSCLRSLLAVPSFLKGSLIHTFILSNTVC